MTGGSVHKDHRWKHNSSGRTSEEIVKRNVCPFLASSCRRGPPPSVAATPSFPPALNGLGIRLNLRCCILRRGFCYGFMWTFVGTDSSGAFVGIDSCLSEKLREVVLCKDTCVHRTRINWLTGNDENIPEGECHRRINGMRCTKPMK